jgi:hypothetical protein
VPGERPDVAADFANVGGSGGAVRFAFSTTAGNAALELENQAAQGRLAEARPLVERLEEMAQKLMRLAGGLSLETLRQQAEATDDRQPVGQTLGQRTRDS